MACSCNKSQAAYLVGSEPDRYPQFPATDFDPMGTYQPPVRMDSSSRKFYGYGEGGAPIYVENVSSKAYLGNMKDGTPIFVNASGEINPLNIVGTAAICAIGLGFGWLVAHAANRYLK